VKLQGFEHQYPAELSGAMQQRATLAHIFATNLEVLLIDESFTTLDAMTHQEMQEELLRIQETSQKTVVFIIHSIDQALIVADCIAVTSARPGWVKAVLDNSLQRDPAFA
jgi:NitT/TauT family transport system ATP-binding protein